MEESRVVAPKLFVRIKARFVQNKSSVGALRLAPRVGAARDSRNARTRLLPVPLAYWLPVPWAAWRCVARDSTLYLRWAWAFVTPLIVIRDLLTHCVWNIDKVNIGASNVHYFRTISLSGVVVGTYDKSSISHPEQTESAEKQRMHQIYCPACRVRCFIYCTDYIRKNLLCHCARVLVDVND